MGLVDTLLDKMFGESLPPASADGDDSAWEQREHNKTIRKQLPRTKSEVIKMADRRSAERYDHMDANIARLKDMAAASRKRKERLRARRDLKAEAAGSHR